MLPLHGLSLQALLLALAVTSWAQTERPLPPQPPPPPGVGMASSVAAAELEVQRAAEMKQAAYVAEKAVASDTVVPSFAPAVAVVGATMRPEVEPAGFHQDLSTGTTAVPLLGPGGVQKKGGVQETTAKQLGPGEVQVHKCKVLAGPVGKVMQGLLFLCCCAVLVFKYRREAGDRAPAEFVMDSSKQLIGAGWIHVLNLSFAKGLEAHFQTGDECQWYWINIVLDCTLGVAVEYFFLILLTRLIQTQFADSADDFESGDYKSSDGQVLPLRYIKQLVMWLVIVSLMKVCMFVIMSMGHDGLMNIAKLVLAPVAGGATLELFTVMIFTPVIMNVFQFWMVDNFIKKKGGQSDDGNSGDWEMDGSMRTRMQHGDM